MSYFHDDDHGPAKGEPVWGLPEPLPEGETILWQGQPAPLPFAVHVFHIRFIVAYLLVMIGWRMASLASNGAGTDALVSVGVSGAVLGAIGLVIVFGLAWLTARSAVFTLTEKRIVMRYGVAIRKYVNLPLNRLGSADLRKLGGGFGDLALTPTGRTVGYIYLWPFARPMKIGQPMPSLRAIADAEEVAALLAKTHAALASPDAQSETPRETASLQPKPQPPGRTADTRPPMAPGRAHPA